MTGLFPAGLDAGLDAGAEAARRLARSRLEDLRRDCQALSLLLADGATLGRGEWRGAAHAMYRVRLAKLGTRVSAALAAVDAAERALSAA